MESVGSFQLHYAHLDADEISEAKASHKKRNSLMHKEIDNFETVINHALGRFKLDMWYDMLSQLIPESEKVTSMAALQTLVQAKKEKVQETGEDPRNDIVVRYFRDFFRDIGQLRRMKDIFYGRIYSVLFEYYYDVDAIQEITDVAITAEENDDGEFGKSIPMSKVKKKNLSKIQQQEEQIDSSQFPPEVVAELADDCLEISGIIGELKRLVFAWGRLLNDPEIDTHLFNASVDEQCKDYDNYQHFEGLLKYIPDVLLKSHQAVVLAKNWWFKAEKIQKRLSKVRPPPSRMVSGRTGTLTGQQTDSQEMIDDDDDDDDEYDYEDADDVQGEDFTAEDKANYSDDFIDGDDDIMEDLGEHGDLSDEDDMFQSSDPGAIVIEKNKTPACSRNDNNVAHNQMDNDEKDTDTRGNAGNQHDKNKRSTQKQDKNLTRKSKPAKARKEFGTDPEVANVETEENTTTTAKDKLQELNANIDAHQRELDMQIEELQTLCERNQRVKALCEQLEDTIGKQISQRKEAQELMTLKESLEELSEQKTTTKAKQKKIVKHLETIDDQLEELLQSGKLREYQNELLKEDLELQLAVSPTLVSYGNQVQDQIGTLEKQLDEERDKLARLQREFDFMARRGKAGQRRHERVKATDGAAKSLSADAVNKSREANISRERKSEKPARHSDGSAGNLRDSYQSASSGSVFLDEGDIEEFDDEEFEAQDGYVEELPENDSGVGEVWEETVKSSKDIPLTPAPPTSKNSKQGKQSKGRQTRGRKPAQKTSEDDDNYDVETSERRQPGSRKQDPASPLPTGETPSNGQDYQTRRRGTVIDKAKSKSKNKRSPKKGKSEIETKPSAEDTFQEDQYKDDDMKTPVQDDFGKADSDADEGKESVHKETGHCLFDPEYLYPDSVADYDHDETEDTKTRVADNDHDETEDRKTSKLEPKVSGTPENTEDTKLEPNKNKKKTKSVKRGRKTTTKDKEEVEMSQLDDAPKQDESIEDAEQEAMSESTDKEPPASNARNKQPKPPTNRSNRARARTRAVPVKDTTSTSEEEAQPQVDQPAKNNKRSVRNRDASKSRRDEPKGKSGKGKGEPPSADKDVASKQDDKVETNREEASEEKLEKTDGTKQRSNRVRKNSIRGQKGATKEPENKPAWKR